MLLRKHLQGARITDVSQKGSERIIEVSLETLNELGFTVSKKLIFEIMGKHSNVILTDIGQRKNHRLYKAHINRCEPRASAFARRSIPISAGSG